MAILLENLNLKVMMMNIRQPLILGLNLSFILLVMLISYKVRLITTIPQRLIGQAR